MVVSGRSHPTLAENIVAKIKERRALEKYFTLIVVAEGAHLPSGQIVVDQDGSQNKQVKLGGIGQVVTEQLEDMIDQDVRCVVLGHLQRGGGPTTFDRVLASQFGAHAVRLVIERKFGQMVCSHPPDICEVSIAAAVDRIRTVDPYGSDVQTARAMGVCFGDTPGYQNPFL